MTDEGVDRGSIGNYKGVMLCNRPPDAGARPVKDGPSPFISRVTVKEQIGLNPTAQLPPRSRLPKKNLEILSRHKRWLADLAAQKAKFTNIIEDENKLAEERKKKLTVKEANRRKDILKKVEEPVDYEKAKAIMTKKLSPEELQDPVPLPNNYEAPHTKVGTMKPAKLTTKNLQAHSAAKPKWAMTEEEAEKAEDEEVDDLLKFAYELDYEAFIEDFQIRQALEIVKERVEEMKKDNEWTKKVVAKYNESEQGERVGGSQASRASIGSYTSQARERIAKERENRSDWDSNTQVGDTKYVNEEERVAKLVADQVLTDHPHFKGVHSNASIRRILETEARKQLTLPPAYEPRITVIQEKAKIVRGEDASNLPYLHRNPAV